MNTHPGIETLPNGQWVVAGDTHFTVWSKQRGNIITDPHLMAWLKPHLEGVTTVLDCGANIGDHTRQYLDWGMQVIAIEPNPLPFACLEHNCPEATCLNIAASDHDGILRFAQLENVGASRVSDSGMLVVEGRKLDDMGLPDPGFLKLDIEGFEVFALRGMIEMLKRAKPILFIEINRGALEANGHGLGDIIEILEECGYHAGITYPPKVDLNEPQYDLLVKP